MKRAVYDLGFVPKAPVGVSAMAVDKATENIAVCRNNGSVEVWSVKQGRPYIKREKATIGRKNHTMRGVIWISKNLFVVGTLGGQLITYNSNTLEAIEVLGSGGGSIWSMTHHPTEPIIAVACQDCRVRFFEYSEDEYLSVTTRYTTMIRPDSDRLLSVKFSQNGNTIYYSDSNGMVVSSQWRSGKTIWESSLTTRLQTHVSKHKVKEGPIISMAWDILEVDDSVICVTSTGEVKIIDVSTGVLRQSIRTHKADLLSIHQIDETVFICGVDNILATLNQMEGDWVKSEGRIWAMGDVTCMVSIQGGILLTGSLDGFIIACETRKMFPSLVGTGAASVLHVHQPFKQHTFPFKKSKMVASVEDYAITLHRIPEGETKEIIAELRYEVGGEHAISSFAINSSGTCMAYSTLEKTCIIALAKDCSEADVIPQSEELPAATSLAFAGCSDLVIGHSEGITTISIDIDSGDLKLLLVAAEPKSPSIVAVSSKNTYLAVVSEDSLLTILKHQSKKRKADAGEAPLSFSVTQTKKLNTAVKDITFCEAKVSFIIVASTSKKKKKSQLFHSPHKHTEKEYPIHTSD